MSMRILSIGNSFSDDAQAFAHAIAQTGGEELEVCNLYIGGCSLQTHWENAQNGWDRYQYNRNGEPVGLTNLETGVLDGPWDVVTLQQASHDSGRYETYQPYLEQLADYVRERAPGARLMLHETWAYAWDSQHPGFAAYGCDQRRMWDQVHAAYARAAFELGGIPVIPCGTAVQRARQEPAFDEAYGGKSLCRDGFHMHLTLGRYLLGAVWFAFLTGRSVLENGFVPKLYRYAGHTGEGEHFTPRFAERPEFTPTPEELAVLRRIAQETVDEALGRK